MTTATLTKRSIVHGTFSLERTYPASPARVFKAFADQQAKARWFGPDSLEVLDKAFDFRVDGVEVLVGRHDSGMVSDFRCTYHDIVPNERIVYAYRMEIDGTPISSSLATIELRPEGQGTHMSLTEYGVYFDGYDDAGRREHGTNWLMDRLGESLKD